MAAKAITVTLAAVGGLVLVGTALPAVVNGAVYLQPAPAAEETDTAGVTSLDVDVDAADVVIGFHDGDEAVLRAEQGSLAGWELRRDGDELSLRSPDRFFDWWSPDWLGEDTRITLLLPESLQGLAADLTLNAGALTADGEFGDLTASVNAGAMTLNGAADTADVEVNAGRADVDLADVSEANLSVSAGRLVSTFTGTAPDLVDIQVSAGALTLSVPEGVPYDVQREVSAGSVDSQLTEETGSAQVITVSVSAGSVTLRDH